MRFKHHKTDLELTMVSNFRFRDWKMRHYGFMQISQKWANLGQKWIHIVIQHKIWHRLIYDKVIFEKVDFWTFLAPWPKSAIMDLPHFWIFPKSARVALNGFRICTCHWTILAKKISCVPKFWVRPLAPGLRQMPCSAGTR